MFSRPVSSGWKPVPTSSRLRTRPRSSALPDVGSVIRLRIFSKVDLPAPFRPMIPTTSPGMISKLTSSSARRMARPGSAGCSPPGEANRRNRRQGEAAAFENVSARVW